MARFTSRTPRLLAVAGATLALAACADAVAPDDVVDPARGDSVARIVPAEEALEGVHLPPLDPATMVPAEIEAAIEAPSICVFRYTSTGRPILATGFGPDARPIQGVVKLAGNLVMLDASAGTDGAQYDLSAGDIRITVSPLAGEDRVAELTFAVGETLQAGYRGYHDCAG